MSSFVTVLHLKTGHVLSAVSSGSYEPTVEQLTAGEHLVVRYFDPDSPVEVPAELLTATRVAAGGDVLDRPHWYVLTDATPPLSLGLEPLSAIGTETGAAGADCIVVWQTPQGPEISTIPLDSAGKPPEDTDGPAGATHRLVAWKDGPLIVEAV